MTRRRRRACRRRSRCSPRTRARCVPPRRVTLGHRTERARDGGGVRTAQLGTIDQAHAQHRIVGRHRRAERGLEHDGLWRHGVGAGEVLGCSAQLASRVGGETTVVLLGRCRIPAGGRDRSRRGRRRGARRRRRGEREAAAVGVERTEIARWRRRPTPRGSVVSVTASSRSAPPPSPSAATSRGRILRSGSRRRAPPGGSTARCRGGGGPRGDRARPPARARRPAPAHASRTMRSATGPGSGSAPGRAPAVRSSASEAPSTPLHDQAQRALGIVE